jgi:hypothetical protein
LTARRPRILVSVPSARMIRAFLETRVFDGLAALDVDLVVVHGHPTLDAFFRGRANISELPYPAFERPTKLQAVARNFSSVPGMLFDRGGDGYIYVKNLWFGRRSWRQSLSILASAVAFLILFGLPFLGRLMRRWAYASAAARDLLAQVAPDAVLLSCPVTPRERVLAQAAEAAGLPIITATDGWDTLTINEHWLRYAGVIVWGPTMRDHARRLGYRDEQILQTGIPYADRLQSFAARVDRDAVRRKWRIDPGERVVVLFISSQAATGDIGPVTVKEFIDGVESGKLPPSKLIVRLPPRKVPAPDEQYYLDQYGNHPLVRVQVPGAGFQEDETVSPPPEIFAEVAEVFAIADVVTSQLSMSLLEGALLGVEPLMLAYEDVDYPTRYVLRSSIARSLLGSGIRVVARSRDFASVLAECYQAPRGAADLLRRWNEVESTSFQRVLEWAKIRLSL